MYPARRSVVVLGPLAVLVLATACASPVRTTVDRIDDTITTAAVKTKLAADRIATLSEIDVETHQGLVTLSGLVDDETLRQRAVYLAGQARGVRAIVNNLQIRQASPPTPPPAPPSAPTSSSAPPPVPSPAPTSESTASGSPPPVPASTSTPGPTPPVPGNPSDEWRMADSTLHGSADDVRSWAAHEAAAQNRAVAYERADGSQRVEAYPLSQPARGGCRWIQQRVFENGRLVDDSSKEVCG
jgi:hyperosmotically inducible protein